MRIPVFARGSNPAIDRPNQRKSLNYCRAEVEAGRADWVEGTDPTMGILCRAFLYSGEKLKPAQFEQMRRLSFRSSLPPLEVGGTQFKDPDQSFTKREDRLCLIVRARAYARFCDLEATASA
jgi:hypothetical protein